jgi:LPXTG-motif cell wall-anchored protein
VLQPGDTITCSYTAKVGDDVHNTVSIEGKDPIGGTVSATDGTFVHPINPAIDIVKSGPATAHEGDSVTYTFKVTNTGDVGLTDVAVTDDVLGNIGTIASLDVDESKTLSKAFTVPTPSTGVDNTATACGTDPLAAKVCDTDKHHLTPLHPAILVAKSGPDGAIPGETVTYSFKVTNTGDVNLTNVTVKDDKLGDVGTIAALAVGESQTLTKDYLIPAGTAAVDNTVTACGVDPLALQVCDNDVHHLTVAQVLGEKFVQPPLAVTGENTQSRLAAGMLILLGALGLAVVRRRRHA